MIGSIFEIQNNMKKLSNPELLQLAQGSPTGNSIEQYAAVSELDARRQMTQPAPQSQSTVLQDMTNQLMVGQSQHPTPAPGDPVGSGIAAIAQQQAAQQPQAMQEGGEIRGPQKEVLNPREKDPYADWTPENLPDYAFMRSLSDMGDIDTSGMRRSNNVLDLAPHPGVDPRAPEGRPYQTLGAQSIYDAAPYLIRDHGRIVALPTTDDEGTPIPREQAEVLYNQGLLAPIGHYPNENVALRDLLTAPTGTHDKLTKMATGGGVTGSHRTNQLLESMQQVQEAISGNYDTTARTPEETRALVGSFQGQDYLTPLLARQDTRDAEAADQRRRNLWLALATGGFTAAGTPGGFGRAIGAGGIAGINAARGAFDSYNDAMNRSEDRRYNIAGAQQGRADAQGRQGLDAFLGGEREASTSRRQLLSDASGIAEAGQRSDIADQDRAAANARQANQVHMLAQNLLEANRGQFVRDDQINPDVNVAPGPDGVIGTPDDVQQEAPTMRPYNEQDALADAIAILNGSRGGSRSGNSLGSAGAAARAILNDPFASDEDKTWARGILRTIGDTANGVATGTQTAGERTGAGTWAAPSGGGRGGIRVDPSQQEAYRQARSRQTGQPIVGQRNGQDVIDPYAQ